MNLTILMVFLRIFKQVQCLTFKTSNKNQTIGKGLQSQDVSQIFHKLNQPESPTSPTLFLLLIIKVANLMTARKLTGMSSWTPSPPPAPGPCCWECLGLSMTSISTIFLLPLAQYAVTWPLFCFSGSLSWNALTILFSLWLWLLSHY